MFKGVMYLIDVDAKPMESELAVWTQVESVLQRTETILHELKVYRGASCEIRDVSHSHFTQSQHY